MADPKTSTPSPSSVTVEDKASPKNKLKVKKVKSPLSYKGKILKEVKDFDGLPDEFLHRNSVNLELENV